MKDDLNIKEIKKLSSVTNQENQVNEHIENGWKLLGVATGNDEGGYPIALYIIGKEEEKTSTPNASASLIKSKYRNS